MSAFRSRSVAVLRRLLGGDRRGDLRAQSARLVALVNADAAMPAPVAAEAPTRHATRKPNLLACQLASTQRLNLPSARARPKAKIGAGNRPKPMLAATAVKRSPAHKVVWLAAKHATPAAKAANVLAFPARTRAGKPLKIAA